jgi:CRISPR/Cas system CMR subunit Cmr4 (Cas7 group RAMP superfamily)
MKRTVVYITIEAKTPIKIGSNKLDFTIDMPIQRDWNNLPMILGTSITGILRKEFDNEIANKIFGDDCSKIKNKKEREECQKNSKGSSIIISNALLVDEENKVNESLLTKKSDFLKIFDNLPVRQHTAINDKGVAKEHSKFDEEVIYKGTRFKFSIEFIDIGKNDEIFKEFISVLTSPTLRIGGGSTKGFGEFEVIEVAGEEFDENTYPKYNSSLNYVLPKMQIIKGKSSEYIEYDLELIPDDFFMFGSGFGDKDADMTPVYESVIDYDNNCLSEEKILIPASSLKGAISHRVAFHFNKEQGYYIGNEQAKTGEENEAVKEIFGSKKDENSGQKGKILFSDCYVENNKKTKVFDHVKIDRFTGGAIDGDLFHEKTIADKVNIKTKIYLKKDIDDRYIKAFESTLNDICSGMLPLGGATTKGHGIFNGKWSKK